MIISFWININFPKIIRNFQIKIPTDVPQVTKIEWNEQLYKPWFYSAQVMVSFEEKRGSLYRWYWWNNLRILITPLVSSNSSYLHCVNCLCTIYFQSVWRKYVTSVGLCNEFGGTDWAQGRKWDVESFICDGSKE